jgi:hypothetical protein
MLVAQWYDFDFCIGLAKEIGSDSAAVSFEGEVHLLCGTQFCTLVTLLSRVEI